MLTRRTLLAGLVAPFVGAVVKADDWSMLDDSPKVATEWDMLGTAKSVKEQWPLADVILFFSAEWCGPCKQIKQTILPELQSKNWRVGTDADCHIYMIDSDKQPDLLSDYQIAALPSFLRLKGGKVVDRLVGNGVTAKAITDLWYKHIDQQTAITQRSQYRRHTSQFTDIVPHSRQRYIEHLASENIHRGKFSVELLNSMTNDELLALHSDDHAGKVDWLSLGIERKSQSGNCANGNCQTIQQYRIPQRSFFGLFSWE